MPEPNSTGDAVVPETPPAPRILGDLQAVTEAASDSTGIQWRLAESGRQLDANVVRLAARQKIDTHTEPDLDVLLLILTGDGVVHAPDSSHEVARGMLIWLPHGSTRSITAGSDGLSYLTVHKRRPGMQIGFRGTS